MTVMFKENTVVDKEYCLFQETQKFLRMAAAAGDRFEDDGEEIELQDPKVWPQVRIYAGT